MVTPSMEEVSKKKERWFWLGEEENKEFRHYDRRKRKPVVIAVQISQSTVGFQRGESGWMIQHILVLEEFTVEREIKG